MTTRSSTPLLPAPVAVAAIIVAVQGAFFVLVSTLLFMSAENTRQRLVRRLVAEQLASRRAGAALLMAVIASAVLYLAFALIRALPWSRVGAIVFEVVVALSQVAVLPWRPVRSAIGLALALGVVLLLLMRSSRDAFARGGEPALPPPPER